KERAERDIAPDREVTAEREDPDLAERRDSPERRAELGHHPDGPDPGGVQDAADALQPRYFLVLLAEALDHTDAGDGSFDHPGHLAGLLLRVPASREQPPPGRNGQREQGWPDGQ